MSDFINSLCVLCDLCGKKFDYIAFDYVKNKSRNKFSALIIQIFTTEITENTKRVNFIETGARLYNPWGDRNKYSIKIAM